MGVVKRQGIKNSVFLYIGTLLGFLNAGILMAKFLTLEQYGLRGVVYQLGSFFSVLSMLGMANVVNRYFYHFKTGDGKNRGFMTFIWVFVLIGALLFSIGLTAAKPLVVNLYSEKASLLVEYFFTLVPFGLSLVFFEITAAFCRVHLKSTIPVFVNEVFIRIVNTGQLFLLYYGIIDFDLFFQLYLFSNWISVVILLVYLYSLGELKLVLPKFSKDLPAIKSMLKFGGYTTINNSSNLLVRTVDILMITYLVTSVAGLAAAGVYNFGMLIANLVGVPFNGIRLIAAPVLARSFKEENMDEVKKINLESSLYLMIAGMFVFVVITMNLESLLSWLEPEYRYCIPVVWLIGITRLVQSVIGMANRTILESPNYMVATYFNVGYLVLVIFSNYLLIPQYEIMGAAMATLGSSLVFVIFRVIYVKRALGFITISPKVPIILMIAAAGMGIFQLLPDTEIALIDMSYQTIIFAVFYATVVYIAKLSPDLNATIRNLLAKIGIALK